MDDEGILRRKAWVGSVLDELAEGLPYPRFGSTAWLALADTDPRKLASAVRAGELWASDGDTLEIAAVMVDLRGEPFEQDPAYDAILHDVVQGIERRESALKARAEAGDRLSIELLEKANDKSWLREESAYDRIKREQATTQ